MPPNFVTIPNTTYKVLTQRTVKEIQCIDELLNGRQWMDGTEQMDGNGCRTKQQWPLNGTPMDVDLKEIS